MNEGRNELITEWMNVEIMEIIKMIPHYFLGNVILFIGL